MAKDVSKSLLRIIFKKHKQYLKCEVYALLATRFIRYIKSVLIKRHSKRKKMNDIRKYMRSRVRDM